MKAPTLRCYHCGNPVTDPFFYRGEKHIFMPVFCSPEHERLYDTARFTIAKLQGLMSWSNCLKNAEQAEGTK